MCACCSQRRVSVTLVNEDSRDATVYQVTPGGERTKIAEVEAKASHNAAVASGTVLHAELCYHGCVQQIGTWKTTAQRVGQVFSFRRRR